MAPRVSCLDEVLAAIEAERSVIAAAAAGCHDESLVPGCGLGCDALQSGQCQNAEMNSWFAAEDAVARVDAIESPRCRRCGTILESSPECRLCGLAELEPVVPVGPDDWKWGY